MSFGPLPAAHRRCSQILLGGLFVLILAACSTSPTGRTQLTVFPSGEINRMGLAAYEEMQQQTPATRDQAKRDYVQCITDALIAELDRRERRMDWEMTVFEDDAVNAFALPGGKMGVYTGLLDVAENQHQLAAVIGHEIGHVLADHGNERMSTAFATTAGLQVVQVIGGEPSPQRDQVMGLLGLGAQFGIILPFSRTQEREADIIGLDLMAKAGFDPRESVKLWQNMSAASGEQPPEFLSTHPSHNTRMRDLQDRMPRAMEYYENARREGKRPDCG
ncbi:MAG: M48 family metallopeptidase [Ectothiorhodospiraceae bacterium]|nr:M48 family metallopeptidase [Ectothiorhodospiraceae bacterium]MCH8505900.1 M48 family metallopeptidase [Ectothiorhodospiraceae bacterium]